MGDLVICTNTAGLVSAGTVSCMEEFRKTTSIDYQWVFEYGEGILGRSRSIAASKFLRDYQASILLFIDSDIVFKSSDIEDVYNALTRKKYRVIGGLYPVAGGAKLAQHSGLPGGLRITGDLVEVQYVSTGFMGIQRNLLEEMRDKLKMPLLQKGSDLECYPFFEDYAKPPLYISEDWDFCDKAREVGAKVWAHTGIQLGHIKNIVYYACDTIKKIGIDLDEGRKSKPKDAGKNNESAK